MIDAAAIKSPNRRRDCPLVLKFRSRKEFQVIGISIGAFGYISLVTFGSRWTPSTRRRRSRRAGGPNRCELLAIGHRARSNNTRKPRPCPLFLFTSPAVPNAPRIFRPRQRFTAIPCKTFTNVNARGGGGGEVCILRKKYVARRANLNRPCSVNVNARSSRIPSSLCALEASNCLGATNTVSKFDRKLLQLDFSFLSYFLSVVNPRRSNFPRIWSFREFMYRQTLRTARRASFNASSFREGTAHLYSYRLNANRLRIIAL